MIWIPPRGAGLQQSGTPWGLLGPQALRRLVPRFQQWDEKKTKIQRFYTERRPLASIGFRTPGIRDILIGIAGGIVMLAGLALVYYVIFPAFHVDEGQQVNQIVAMPFWWRLITVIRAAVAEEVLFRGYAIERIEQVTGSVRIAGALSCVVFTVIHVGFWGWGHLLVAGFAGALLTLLYLWRRNLWVTIIAHFIVDGVAFLVT